MGTPTYRDERGIRSLFGSTTVKGGEWKGSVSDGQKKSGLMNTAINSAFFANMEYATGCKKTSVGDFGINRELGKTLRNEPLRDKTAYGEKKLCPSPTGEGGPGQDGLSGPWADFREAKMASLDREKSDRGPTPLGAPTSPGGGLWKSQNPPLSFGTRAQGEKSGLDQNGMLGHLKTMPCTLSDFHRRGMREFIGE